MEIGSSTQAAAHCVKRLAVAACDDGGPEGRPIRIDDCEHTIFEGKTSGNGTDETGHTPRPDQTHSVDLLQQMTVMSYGPELEKADARCTEPRKTNAGRLCG